MMRSNTLLKTPILLLLPAFLFSQSFQTLNNQNLNKKTSWLKIIDQSLSGEEFFKLNKKELGISSEKDLELKSIISSKNNWKHLKYNQFYNDIPVLCGTYTLHKRNNQLIKGSGSILPNIDIETKPKLTPEVVVEIAKNNIFSTQFENDNLTINEDNFEYSKPKLVIVDKLYPNFSGEYLLAYEVNIKYNTNQPHNDKIIVNANSGEILKTISQICFINVDGIAHTKYSGKQKITVDSINKNKFLLQDLSRGEGIFTVNYYTDKVFIDEDNNWNNVNKFQDEAATDAHFGAISFYDFLKNRYDWNGLDNNGFELRSLIHYNYGQSYANAFWDGEKATFGDGDCGNYGPLTSLDVVSHEFTHGFTEFTSKLIYANESGALNESMSDIFGKVIEYHFGLPNTFDWDLGSKFIKSDDAEPFRSMKNPKLYGDPMFYKGENWSTIQEVHTNSGILNYWFYLLCEGGKSENELGIQYDIKPIGIDKAIDIVFLMQVAYLVPNSNYFYAYNASMEATKELFGENSDELNSVKEAWKAVGV